MKFERLHITIFVLIAAMIWMIVLFFNNTAFTWEHAKPFGIVVGCLVILGVLFEHVLWYHPWLHTWFVKRPDLRGTWKIELQSSYIRTKQCTKRSCNEQLSNGGERVPMIICYMAVKQTLSTLQMHLMTPESDSVLIADRIRLSPNGKGYQIIGVYANEPNIHLRGDGISQIHQGAFIAETHGSDLRPNTLTAKYWTDRKTTGSMDFTLRVDEVFSRFEDADREFPPCASEDVPPL